MTTDKQIKILVNNKVFISNKWTLSTQMQYLPKLGKVLAVPLGFIIGAASDGESNLKDAIPSALFMLFESLEDNDQTELFQGLLSKVYVDNGTRLASLDSDFDDLDELFTVLTKVIEQNYGSLIGGKSLGNLAKLLIPLNQMASQ
jgi:hypothetical protein